jgi:hypothetical protein
MKRTNTPPLPNCSYGKEDKEHKKMEVHGAEDQVPARTEEEKEEARREIVATEVEVSCHPIYGDGDGPELTGFFSSGHSCDYIDASASHGARYHLPSYHNGCKALKAFMQPTNDVLKTNVDC